ncbi:MAG: restriction endonuclease subunit S [Pseudonocardiaceae bacterium]
MSKYPFIPLQEVLTKSGDFVSIDPEEQYETAGILNRGRGLFRRPTVSGSETRYTKYNRLHAGQFVYSKLFAWEGALATVTPEFDGLFVSHEFPTFDVVEERAIPDYIAHLARWSDLHIALSKQTSGMGSRRQRVNIGQLLSTPVPIPDIKEQQRIADKLDLLLSKNDSIVTSTGFASFPQVKSLFTSGLDRLLAKWADGSVRVEATCDIIGDLVRPGEDPAPAQEFIGLEHIEPHLGRRTGSRPLGDEKGRKFRFQPGDILYGYLRPYLNKVWVADRHGLCSVEQYVLRPNGVMSAELIAAALRSKKSTDRVVDLTHNLQLPRLRSGLLMSLEIPLVPLEQQEAVAELSTYMKRCERYVDLLMHRNELLAGLRSSILNAAFTGQL